MTKGDFAASAVQTGRLPAGTPFDYVLPRGWLEKTVNRLAAEYPDKDRLKLYDFLVYWFVWSYREGLSKH